MAEKTGRCEIRPESYARKIEIDGRGRATGVLYFGRDGREIFQRSRAVTVCANGAETPRLLLMSKSNLFPDGLANSSGLVGHYLMLDSGSFSGGVFEHALGVFEHALNEYKSVQVTRLIQDFYDADPKRGFYGGGGLDARFDFYPITFALGGLSPGTPEWGVGLKQALREDFTRSMFLLSHSTTLPMYSNNVSLDPKLKDAWGLLSVRDMPYGFG